MGYGRARVHRCSTLVRPARQQGGVQVLRPCLGSMQLLCAIRSPTSLSWTPIHFGSGLACIRLGPTTTRRYAAPNRPRVPPAPGRTVIRSPASHEQGPTPRRNTHGSMRKGQYILLYDRCGRRGALVAGRTLLRGERASRPLSRPSLLLLAWKRVIRARGGLDPQRPSSRLPPALGWATSDEWAHGRATSTARAPRRQRRPRRPAHSRQACAPWSTCSPPMPATVRSRFLVMSTRVLGIGRVTELGLALSRPGTFYSAGSTNGNSTDSIQDKRHQDTLGTHTRYSCKCT